MWVGGVVVGVGVRFDWYQRGLTSITWFFYIFQWVFGGINFVLMGIKCVLLSIQCVLMGN